LSLYPAQSRIARLARRTLHLVQHFCAPPGTEAVDLRFAADAPFVQFLGRSQNKPGPFTFAMLLGNPNVAGRRFVLLLFDAGGQPVRVVKAGAGVEAKELIQREARFLKSFPAGLLHAPSLYGEFGGDGIAALAMEYVPGPTPDANNLSPLAGVLGSWLRTDKKVNFTDLPIAQKLLARIQHNTVSPDLIHHLRAISFCPAIHHGDFAPWNIRIDPASKRWKVLDWERGEPEGPPAWDWFHYVIQPAALVRRESPLMILRRVSKLLQSPAFKHYAARAEIGTAAETLLRTYLVYCCEVTQQTEGIETIKGLTELVIRRTSV
jgi:hypothetical protein